MTTPDPKQNFLTWFLTPENKRGPLATMTAWAKANGFSERTVRRWKTEDWFLEAVATHDQMAVAQTEEQRSPKPPVGGSTPPRHAEEGDAPSGDEADYQEVKRALVAGARNGNPKYLDLYFRTYGKPFVEEEVAARSTDLSGENLEDLVTRAVLALGPELVAQALRLDGWTVVGPS
jgi:hypothetical protein